MGLDIRIPMGILFTLIGALLLLYGLLSADRSGALLAVNLNAVWGTVLLGFGACMGGLAHRHRRRIVSTSS